MKIFFSFVIILFLSINVTNAAPIKELYKKAEKADKEQKFDDAIDYYTQIISKDSSQIEAFFYRGLDFLMLGEFELSVIDLDKYIEKDTTNADAYNNRGLAKSYTDMAVESFTDFTKAISLNPKMEQAYINRAAVYLAVNDDVSAKADIETALKINPKNPSIRLNLARIQYKKKNFQEAIDNYTIAIQSGLFNTDIYYKRGNSYYRLNDFHNAISDYTLSLNLDSNNIDALNNRAMAYENLGYNDSAAIDRTKLEFKKSKKKKDTDDGINLSDTKIAYYSDNSFGIKIPDEFHTFRTEDSLARTLFFTREPMESKSDVYGVGGYIEMFYPADSILGTSNPEELLDYWKGITTKGFDVFKMVKPEFQKTKPWGADWVTIYTKSKIRINDYTQNVIYLNYGLAKNNVLVNVHFEVPEELIDKYQPFFEDAINSIIVHK